jgi:uncharacterized membrane protein
MNPTVSFILTVVIAVLVDIPWLSFIGGTYMETVQRLQGGAKPVVRYLPAALVYVAIAFLVRKTKSIQEAFLTGMAAYAIYDFTVMTIFKDYPLHLAVADTIWGGVLFATTRWLLDVLNVLKV